MRIGYYDVNIWKMMNEQYNKTIEFNGNIYHYDPDHDIFYRKYDQDMSKWDKWGWIAVTCVLLIAAIFLENN